METTKKDKTAAKSASSGKLANGTETAQASKKADTGYTELVFLLDRSGSMTGLETDTIGGFNGMLAKHKKASGRAVVSTVLFDHSTVVLHDRVDIQEIKALTTDDYSTRGSTALLDALGSSIRHISRVQRYMPEGHKAQKVIFVITTDGMENSSSEYSVSQVREMVSKMTEKYGWEFVFLGANIDAVAEAGNLGISEDRAVTYYADPCGTAACFEAVADFTCAARTFSSARQGEEWKRAVEKDRALRF